MTDYVSFRIGEQLCGIEASQVQQVFRPRGLTPVPLAPPEIAGIMSLRGRIVTAVCARRRLGLPPGPDSFAIGLEFAGDGYGLLVDAVGEVLSLDDASLEPTPGILPPAWADCVTAVCSLEDGLLLVLDAPRLLSPGYAEGEAA